MKLRQVFAFVTWALAQWSCQSAIEPTAEIAPTSVVVVVRDQRGQPIEGARVQWIVTRRGVSQAAINAAFAAAVGPSEAYTGSGGFPGTVAFDIPVPVADEQALILLRTTPPPDPGYRGIQKNGDWRIDTIIPCGPTALQLTLLRQFPVACNQSVPCSDLDVRLAPGRTDTAAQGDFVQTDADVIIQQVIITGQVPAGVQVVPRVRVGNGAPQAPPVSVPRGQPYRIEFVVSASASASTVDTTLQATIVVVQSGGAPCWQCTFPMRIQVRPEQLCDCPQAGIRRTAIITACIGTSRDTTIAIGLINTNQQCNLSIVVQPNQRENINELSIVQLNNIAGQSIIIPANRRLDSIRIRFTPQQARTYRETFILRIYRQTAQGLQLCDSSIVIDVTGTSGQPSFGIDSARSTIFQFGQNGYQPDTLVNCTTRDDPRNSRGTLCIRNTSSCLLSGNVRLQGSSLFTIEGGAPVSLRLQPGADTCITVAFIPTTAAVYPLGRCSPAQRNFSATVIVSSSNQTATVPVYGYANLDVQCASKATAALYEFGTQDANGTRYFITINIVQSQTENTLLISEQLDGRPDSVEIYVQRIITTGPPPNDANISSAILATGSASGVEFNIVARNMLSLPQDICLLFNQYGCSFDPTQWTRQPTVREGDILLFRFGGSYGILWVKKLSWSNRSTQALPQVEVLTCYPFN
ncbi:MAG: hypothetical protein N2663_07850 [Chlorobi bacterium]|nr:hypothetical protein [Chlorobiota bacterium]